MRKIIYAVLVIFLLAFTLTSCSDGDVQPKSTDASAEQGSAGTEMPYPVAAATEIPLPTVTQDPTLSTVKGTIYYRGKPLPGTILFLATVLKDQSGAEVATSLDRTQAPQTLTDENGNFEFRNVPEGRYGLTLLDVMTSYLLLNPQDGSAILLTVDKSTTIDLGKFEFEDLPVE